MYFELNVSHTNNEKKRTKKRFFPFLSGISVVTFDSMAKIITAYPEFFTATILEWKNLLQPDKYKDIVVNSLRFLVKEQRIKLYGFVIMWNHQHLIWQMMPGMEREDVQRDFLKGTAKRIKADLRYYHPQKLKEFRVNAKDRRYQIWEKNSLSVELRNEKVFRQKLDYLHNNPVRAGICKLPEEYKYSSAKFYNTGVDNWGFLSHYRD